jgi:hypothetical protein
MTEHVNLKYVRQLQERCEYDMQVCCQLSNHPAYGRHDDCTRHGLASQHALGVRFLRLGNMVPNAIKGEPAARAACSAG